MTEAGPLSRPFSVETIPAAGAHAIVEATAEERAILARDFKLDALDRLVGTYTLTRRGHAVKVSGAVKASVVQTCVVTLEAFATEVEEPVDLRFTDDPDPPGTEGEGGEHEAPVDAPDPIVNGRIDLGSVTAEFLALALDPYPRKPGASFAWEDTGDADPSPFAALGALKKRPPD